MRNQYILIYGSILLSFMSLQLFGQGFDELFPDSKKDAKPGENDNKPGDKETEDEKKLTELRKKMESTKKKRIDLLLKIQQMQKDISRSYPDNMTDEQRLDKQKEMKKLVDELTKVVPEFKKAEKEFEDFQKKIWDRKYKDISVYQKMRKAGKRYDEAVKKYNEIFSKGKNGLSLEEQRKLMKKRQSLRNELDKLQDDYWKAKAEFKVWLRDEKYKEYWNEPAFKEMKKAEKKCNEAKEEYHKTHNFLENLKNATKEQKTQAFKIMTAKEKIYTKAGRDFLDAEWRLHILVRDKKYKDYLNDPDYLILKKAEQEFLKIRWKSSEILEDYTEKRRNMTEEERKAYDDAIEKKKKEFNKVYKAYSDAVKKFRAKVKKDNKPEEK